MHSPFKVKLSCLNPHGPDRCTRRHMIQGTQPNWWASFPNSAIATPCAYSFPIIVIPNKMDESTVRRHSFCGRNFMLFLTRGAHRERGIGRKKLIKRPELWENCGFCQSHLNFPAQSLGMLEHIEFDYHGGGTIRVNPYLGVFHTTF